MFRCGKGRVGCGGLGGFTALYYRLSFQRFMPMGEKKHYVHYIETIPDDLLGAIQESRCVALVGAGVSRRSLSKARVPLPGWINLLEDLCQWALEKQKLEGNIARDLQQLLERREY